MNLVPRAKRLLDLLSREPSDPAQDRQDLASILFATVVRSADCGGNHPAEGAIDVNSTLRFLDDTLTLVEKARAYVGIPCSTGGARTLEQHEFQKALRFCKRSFSNKKYFMANKTLARHIQERDKYPNKFTRAEKNHIHTDRRGAFKSWEKRLLGHAPLLHAVLRHGLFDTRDMGEFMVAYTQLKKESRDDVVAAKARELCCV